MRVALRILRERLRLLSLIPGSLRQLLLNRLLIRQGFLQIGRKQTFLLQTGQRFYQFT